jgi:WD40 repeat protein/serine/threonine protein kinase
MNPPTMDATAAVQAPPPEARNGSGSSLDDPRVVRAVQEYLALLENGSKPNRSEFIARYPDIAAPLADCLAGLELVQAIAPQLSAPVADAVPDMDADLRHGRMLGDFRLRREVGRGGMGVVYEAEQVSLGRRVALKVLPFASTLDARQLQRFKNEAQTAAQLHHTNIVPVYAVGCERGIYFYAMQFIDGQTLGDVIAALRQEASGLTNPTTAYTPLEPVPQTPAEAAVTPSPAAKTTEQSIRQAAFFRRAARLGSQAATALEHAHQFGVVHRDIKPANLLLDERGELWVTDFGLAQVQSDTRLTMTGDLVGTLRYMSPEQALGHRPTIDHRTDIYSLGATLYELLTLEPAFGGQNRQELLRQIVSDEPRSPRRINKAIPAELEIIVLKAMAKEASERYATAQALADDLEHYLKDEPIRARRPTPWQRLARWTRRRKSVVVTAGVALVLLLLLSVIGLSIGIASVRAEAEAKVQAQEGRVIEEQKRAEAEGQRAEAEKTRGDKEAQRANEEEQKVVALQGWRRTAYYQEIALALHEYRANNCARANEMLDSAKCPEDLRGWEWHYLKRLCRSELSVTPLKAPESYRLITLSADGRRAAFFSGSALLYDTTTGKEVRRFTPKGDNAGVMAFGPDGKWFAMCGNDRPGAGRSVPSVRVWNALSGEEAAVLRGADRWGTAQPPPGVYFGLRSLLVQSRIAGQTLAPAGGGLALPVQLAFDYEVTRLDMLYLWPGEIRSVAFSPDGQLVAATDTRGRLHVWERATGKMLFRRHAHPIPNKFANEVWFTNPTFSPDGKLVATACSDDATFKLWDAKTGNFVRSLWQGPLDKDEGFSQAVFSPKGKWIAAAGRNADRFPDPTVRVWEVGPGRPRYIFRGTKPFTCLAFSPDEGLLAAGNADNTLTIWELTTGQEVATYRSHERGVVAVAFRDNRQVVSLDGNRTARTWDATRGPEYRTFRTWTAWHAAISADGRRVAAAASQFDPKNRGFHTLVWDAETGQVLMKYENKWEGPRMVAFSPDGKQVASAISIGSTDSVVRVRDASTGVLIRNLPDQSPAALGPAHLLAQGFGAQAMAPGAGHWGPLILNLAALPVLKLEAFNVRAAPCDAVAWSPDGKLIASGAQDRVVRLWDAATGAQVRALPGHSRTVSVLAFSRDSKRLASASGGINRQAPMFGPNPLKLPSDSPKDIPDVKVWEVATGKELHSFSFPGKGPGMALSPDGETLAVTFGAALGGDVVRLYRVATGKELAVLKGHTQPPWSVAFSPDGLRIVTGGGADETIKLWNAKSGEEIMTVGRHPGIVSSVSFSPDGQKIVSTSDDRDVRLWDATPSKK